MASMTSLNQVFISYGKRQRQRKYGKIIRVSEKTFRTVELALLPSSRQIGDSSSKHVMIKRIPKPTFWKIIKNSAKTLFVIEVVLFGVSYGVYYRMNRDREFRQYMNENFPYFLDGFYKIGELFGDTKQREIDARVWRTLSKKSSD